MRAVIAALAANLGIAVAKFAAFLVTGSASMLAESVHSLADTGNETLLLIGRGRSRRARTAGHPFGFGRERYFYGFVVAVMLFTVGAVFSLYDGIHKVFSPGELDSPAVAYAVLGLSAVLEAFSLRTAIREANEVRAGRGWRQFVHATKTPELPVVLLEDTAALLGLAFAFLGVLLSQVTGNDEWDGAGSVGVGLLLGCAAFIVGYETKSLLIGESATDEVSAEIIAAVENGPGHFRVIHLRTSHIGPESLLVTAKIGVPGTLSAATLAGNIDAVEKRIRRAVPIAETIYLEPDIYHPEEADATDPSVEVVTRSRPNRIISRAPRAQGGSVSQGGLRPSLDPPRPCPASRRYIQAPGRVPPLRSGTRRGRLIPRWVLARWRSLRRAGHRP